MGLVFAVAWVVLLGSVIVSFGRGCVLICCRGRETETYRINLRVARMERVKRPMAVIAAISNGGCDWGCV